MRNAIGMLVVLLIAVGCAKAPEPFRVPASCPADRVTGGDWSSLQRFEASRLWVTTNDKALKGGLLRWLALDPPRLEAGAEDISGDSVVRIPGGLDVVFVINRFQADNIQVVDSKTLRTLCQFPVGRGTNPYDIVMRGPVAYVSRYQSSSILKYDLVAGKELGEISLAKFSDADGAPEMTLMSLEGDELSVQMQRLLATDLYEVKPTTPNGLVAKIDLATDAITEEITLPYKNPMTAFRVDSRGELQVGLAGAYGKADGGIVTLSKRTILTEAALNADIVDYVLDGDKGFALIVTFAKSKKIDDRVTRILQFDAVTGVVDPAPVLESEGPSYANFSAIALDPVGHRLFVGDRRLAEPGIIVFDVAGATPRRFDKISVGLLPSSLMPGR